MDRAIDAAAAEQRGVRGIDDGVGLEAGDIAGRQTDPRLNVGGLRHRAIALKSVLRVFDIKNAGVGDYRTPARLRVAGPRQGDFAKPE